eukprot:9444424-Pyramimonas_sp.AAC.1
MARSNLSLRCAPTVLSPPQQASNVTTVSQIAAAQGWRGLIWIRGEYPLCCAPQQPSKVVTI